MVPTANWSYPTEIRFGPGRVGDLPEVCAQLGLTRPLMVTGPALAAMPHTDHAFAMLRNVGRFSELFTGVTSSPTDNDLAAGIKAYRAGDHDGVVAYGGGSALDLGKLIALMARQTHPVWDFEMIDQRWKRAVSKVIDPVIAIPTTAGTGSEVSAAAVLTHSETHRRVVIFHPKMLPSTVIADPQLAVSVPAGIAAGTGMNALTNGMEALCSNSYHPMSQAIAVNCIGLLKENLPSVLADPQDINARANMASASIMGGVAANRGLGAVHALSHAIGARYGTHHGTTCAVLLPYVIATNRPAIGKRLDQLTDHIGLQGGFFGILKWLVELRQSAGIPHALPGLLVDNGQFEAMAESALQDPWAAGNPAPLTKDGALSILNAAYTGALPI